MTIQHVTDYRSNENDQIVYAANKIGRSKYKKEVFEAVYFGKQKIKTVNEIAERTRLNSKQVLDNAKKLVIANLIHQTTSTNGTAYEKDDAYKGVWRKVLKLAGNKKAINKIPTKVNSRKREKIVVIKIPKSQVKTEQITIDDVSSFAAVKKIKTVDSSIAKIPENKFKKGILNILGETKDRKDWGGEKNDIFTNKLKIKSKRYYAAFALKGPGLSVKKLTPKNMGKNGDQIQRLTASSAQVFFVQYWREIDQSVVDLMQQLANAKSYSEGRLVYFSIIDGEDSARLIKAYPNAFK